MPGPTPTVVSGRTCCTTAQNTGRRGSKQHAESPVNNSTKRVSISTYAFPSLFLLLKQCRRLLIMRMVVRVLPHVLLLTVCLWLVIALHAAAGHAVTVPLLVAGGLSDAVSHVVLIPLILMSPSASAPSPTTSSTASHRPPSPRTATVTA